MKKLLFFLLMVVAVQGNAQVIQATINVTYSHLSNEAQNELQDFNTRLQDYVNGYEWTNDPLEVVIPVRINIIIESESRSGGTPLYRAQFQIASPSGENFYEKNWSFRYSRNEIFTHDRVGYHPIGNMIDFFIYMVIGGEADTYGLLRGTEFYDLARNSLSIAKVADGANWSGKEKDFNDLMDSNHLPLREAKYYYYENLMLINLGEGIDVARIRENNKRIIERLKDVSNRRPNSKHLKRFFDAHFQEICTVLKYDETPENLQVMIMLDQLHRDTYQKCIDSMGK